MQDLDFTLSNGSTVTIRYNPKPSTPGRCIVESTGNQNFSCWGEFLDALLATYEFHARQTGKAFDLRWGTKGGREIHFHISPDKPAVSKSPDPPPLPTPDEIRAKICEKLSPDFLAQMIESLPPERGAKLVATYLLPRPVKRTVKIITRRKKS